MSASRKLVGRTTSLAGSEVVYLTADGFEVEKTSHYKVEELRVFCDDVMLVTIHRELGPAFVVLTGLASLFFGAIAIFFLLIDDATWPAAVMFGIFGSPFIIAFLVRLIFRLDVVTIFGRRSTARMRYAFRKRRAREVYEQVCAAVREAQRRRETEAVPEPVSAP
jgi:hypothetical protein